jgi:pantetheine-phosphate adenylyltransferase
VTAAIANVEVRPFSGLAVGFVRSIGAGLMLRGIRTTSDMEHEFDMSLTNLALDPEIETVFLMASARYTHISSTLIRQIASFGGDLSPFVPSQVQQALLDRARARRKG